MNFTHVKLAVLLFATLSFGVAQSTDVADLPVRTFPSSKKQTVLLIYFTGDGGWNNFSQELISKIRSYDYPVVVFDSRKYFWNSKTPHQFSVDVQRLITYYLEVWDLDEVAVIGYSFGADVASFLPSEMKKEYTDKMLPMVLLSPSYSSDFEVKLSDLMGSSSKVERKYNVQEALLKSTIKILCVFGEEEDLYLKGNLGKSDNIEIKEIPGSHRYEGNMDLLGRLIMTQIKK